VLTLQRYSTLNTQPKRERERERETEDITNIFSGLAKQHTSANSTSSARSSIVPLHSAIL
jgi:hypothetical protein